MTNTPANIRNIALDRIHTTPADRTADEELVASVKQHGILQPIGVIEDGDGYRILYGARRASAAKLAGLHDIPAVVHPADLPEDARRVLCLVENLQRLDNSPIEQGRAFAELVGLGLSIGEVAHRVGKSPSFVRQRMTISTTIPAHALDLLPPDYSVSALALLCRLPLPVLVGVLENQPEATTDVELARDAVRRAGRPLDAAPFPTSDCGSCRKRTGADLAAFGSVGGDSCFDPSCYERKVSAHVGHAIATIRRKLPTVPCIVTRSANHAATPELGELYASNGAAPLPRKKRIAEDGEPGTPAICLDGGDVRLVNVTDDAPDLDGRAFRHSADGQRSLDLRRRLDDALDGAPRPVRDSDLPRLVKGLVAALEGRDDVTATDAWATLLRLHAPALRARIKPAPDADLTADFRRLSALLDP